jgi:hypothetical protein
MKSGLDAGQATIQKTRCEKPEAFVKHALTKFFVIQNLNLK